MNANVRVSPVLQHLDGHAVFGVDHPQKQVAVRLDAVERNALNQVIAQLLVANRHLCNDMI